MSDSMDQPQSSTVQGAPVRKRRTVLKRALKVVIALPFLWWLYTKMFWPSTVLDAPEIAANLYAKEMCSCVFLVEQSDTICRENTKQWIPSSTIRTDLGRKRVNVRVWWALAQAKYHGPREGCRIELNPVD